MDWCAWGVAASEPATLTMNGAAERGNAGPF